MACRGKAHLPALFEVCDIYQIVSAPQLQAGRPGLHWTQQREVGREKAAPQHVLQAPCFAAKL